MGNFFAHIRIKIFPATAILQYHRHKKNQRIKGIYEKVVDGIHTQLVPDVMKTCSNFPDHTQ